MCVRACVYAVKLLFVSICRSFWDCGSVALDDISLSLGDCELKTGERSRSEPIHLPSTQRVPFASPWRPSLFGSNTEAYIRGEKNTHLHLSVTSFLTHTSQDGKHGTPGVIQISSIG